MKKPLEPLMPLEQFQKLVAQIAKVPKDRIEEACTERPKRERRKKND
jgi:hypothetical protein